MEPSRRLHILSCIAQRGRCPGDLQPSEVIELTGLARFYAWPQMSLTPAGWRVIDAKGALPHANATTSGTDAA